MALIADLSAWYEKTAHALPGPHDIVISTLDNPGWHVKIRQPQPRPDAIITRWGEEDDKDWLDVRFRENCYDGAAGPRQLGTLLAVFFERVAGTSLPVAFQVDPLFRLQEWYASRCDGEWEHDGGVRLVPSEAGWELELRLYDGYWKEPSHKPPPVSILASSKDYIRIMGSAAGIDEFLQALRPLSMR